MSSTYSRLDRINDTIKRELAILIQQSLNDPRIGMVSVTAVKVSKDLSHAKVFVSFLEEGKAVVEGIAALNHASTFLRYQLAQRIDLRVMPLLRFYYDDSLLRASRITSLIDDAIDKHNDDKQ